MKINGSDKKNKQITNQNIAIWGLLKAQFDLSSSSSSSFNFFFFFLSSFFFMAKYPKYWYSLYVSVGQSIGTNEC